MLAAVSSISLLLLASSIFSQIQGAKVYYKNDDRPDELDVLELVLNEEVKRSESESVRDNAAKEAAAKMWFGPRLGRRRRSVEDAERLAGNILNREEALLKLAQDGPWALYAIRGGKRRTSGHYTPRLGRDSDEEIVDNFMEPSVYRGYSRPPTRSGGEATGNFTPRLGRLAPVEGH